MYGLAHVDGWEPCYLHDLRHISCVGFVLHRSRTHVTTARYDLDDLDRDLSEV